MKANFRTRANHAQCPVLGDSIGVDFLEELAPGAFQYGMTCVVEFDPQSLWHEISLAIAAQAMRHGAKVEFHIFQRTPKEIRKALGRRGLDIDRLERANLFRVMDSYTTTTPLTGPPEGKTETLLSGKSPDVTDWTKTIKQRMRDGFEEAEKRWLHIDDNETILLQFNTEEAILNGWRTTFVPMAKSRELLILHALVTGIASESFYRKTEAMADAIIDFRVKEEGESLENYVRLRTLRETKFDSTWHRVELKSDGEIIVGPSRSHDQMRLAAVMFTDMVGYTAMVQTDERRGLRVLRDHRELVRSMVAKHGGTEVKTMGDAFLIEFPSALAATDCAVEMQGAIRQYNMEKTESLQVKIGIHVGDVIHEKGDVYGDAVNIASRIEPLAEGGGICISEQVYDQVKNKVPLRFSKLEPLGLKNVLTPVTVYRLELPAGGG